MLSIDSKLEIECEESTVKFYITPEANSEGDYEQESINIYELAYKCKEWALEHKLYLTSSVFKC